ncbi:hypothetical protein [Amycolatopsis sp. cmx-4-61]|uniref:hypothetical protein n=1 Tax=Amycolatopsis sp. cmx-4-61 TaxID=2790937 RepID=UPI00397DECD9
MSTLGSAGNHSVAAGASTGRSPVDGGTVMQLGRMPGRATQVPAAPVPLVTLQLALEQAQHAFERRQYSELTGGMPRLIAAAHASRDAAAGQLREWMSAALARE